jgi:hypothetical protein
LAKKKSRRWRADGRACHSELVEEFVTLSLSKRGRGQKGDEVVRIFKAAVHDS